ncbi:hypothetical protein ACFT4A_18500 [Streptomyces sp. NPDC057099]|uniref:hypothetical protein n=1 Tax=Streptomyces sp. NPDC057099 TaxID=3346019 RepID=UPI003627D1E9
METDPNAAVLRITSLEKVDAVFGAVPADWFDPQVLSSYLPIRGKYRRFVESLISVTPQAMREGMWQWHAQVELILTYRDGRRTKAVSKEANLRPQSGDLVFVVTDSPGFERRIEVALW